MNPIEKKTVIGLVGLSGSGKNEAAHCFEKHNALCIDADKVASDIISENAEHIIQMFYKNSPTIKNADGSLNKAALSKLLFSNSQLLKKQELFILPLIEARITRMISETDKPIVVLNAPTLHKTKLINVSDEFIFIKALYLIRLHRIRKRDGISYRQIIHRFHNQKNFFSFYKVHCKKTGKKLTVISNNLCKRNLERSIGRFEPGGQ